jgi:hypothetical protein
MHDVIISEHFWEQLVILMQDSLETSFVPGRGERHIAEGSSMARFTLNQIFSFEIQPVQFVRSGVRIMASLFPNVRFSDRSGYRIWGKWGAWRFTFKFTVNFKDFLNFTNFKDFFANIRGGHAPLSHPGSAPERQLVGSHRDLPETTDIGSLPAAFPMVERQPKRRGIS